MADKEKKPPIGALWEKTTRAGVTFLSGEVDIDGKKTRVTCFQNTFKKPGEKSPDWRIFVDDWEPGQRSEAPVKPQEDRHARPHDVEIPVPTYDEESIPF